MLHDGWLLLRELAPPKPKRANSPRSTVGTLPMAASSKYHALRDEGAKQQRQATISQLGREKQMGLQQRFRGASGTAHLNGLAKDVYSQAHAAELGQRETRQEA